MTDVTLSGRSREHLQAEADLLGAQESLKWAERYKAESTELIGTFIGLINTYPDHGKLLQRALQDAEHEVRWSTAEIEIARTILARAEEAWERQGNQ